MKVPMTIAVIVDEVVKWIIKMVVTTAIMTVNRASCSEMEIQTRNWTEHAHVAASGTGGETSAIADRANIGQSRKMKAWIV